MLFNSIIVVSLLSGCWVSNKEVGQMLGTWDSASGETDDTNDTNDTDAGGFTLSGTVRSLVPGGSVSGYLCVDIACFNASTGDYDVEASSTVDVDAYSVPGIDPSCPGGLLVLIRDCEEETTVMPMATFLPYESYAGLGDGDVLGDLTAYTMDTNMRDLVQGLLEEASYTSNLEEDGVLAGFVVDFDGSPIDGATIESPATVYYYTGSGFDTKMTRSSGLGMFAIPSADLDTYFCSAQKYDFNGLTIGSFLGVAVVVTFIAD